MSELADGERITTFMTRFGGGATRFARVYLSGGATAVLLGWRPATIDLDLRLDPEWDDLLRLLPPLKKALRLNVELASPDRFIPELAGWQERSLLIRQEGRLAFFHYDFYSQALARLERSHASDMADVEALRRSGLIDDQRLYAFYLAIEPQLYRFPAIHPPAFRRAVESFVGPGSEAC